MTSPIVIDRAGRLSAAQTLYEQGDAEAAFARFAELAAEDDPDALFWMATMLAHGDGTGRDQAAAYRSCLRSAELGHAAAATNLGVMLVQGAGCAADPEAGLAWLRQAAEAGDLGAQFNAATLLSAGKVVDKDLEMAAHYYQRAARAGYHPAQARLGYAYRHGFGVPRDRRRAFLWLSLAARHGAGTAISMLEGLITEMSPDELHDAQTLLDQQFDAEDPTLNASRFRVKTG